MANLENNTKDCISKELEKGIVDKEQWTYTIDPNSDIWLGGIYDTREEAIAVAKKEAIDDNQDSFRIGIIEKAANLGIDVDSVIENIQEAMWDEYGEVAEDYLGDVRREDLIELEEKLNNVYHEWQEKHDYGPSFYKVISEEIIKVK